MSLSRLSEMIAEEALEKKIVDRLLKFGERIQETTVRLAKKKVDDE